MEKRYALGPFLVAQPPSFGFQWMRRSGDIGVTSRLLLHSDSVNTAYAHYTSGLSSHDFARIRAGEVGFGDREALEVCNVLAVSTPPRSHFRSSDLSRGSHVR